MFCYGSSAICLAPFPFVTRCMLLTMLRGMVNHRWRGAMWRHLLQWRGVVRRMRGVVWRHLLQWHGVVWQPQLPRYWRGAMWRRLLRWRGIARRLRLPRQWPLRQ